MLTSSTIRSKDNNASATISYSDFMRIRNTIVGPINEEDQRKKVDTSYKASSQQRMRQWPDSIEMAKKNKLESRKKVFFENEMEKRKLDEEERKFQEIQKKIVVERANKLLFEAQDPVKSFNSKLLLADVLKEREYQRDISERKKEIEFHREMKWTEIEHENMREYDNKQRIKQEEERKKRENQLNVINSQFNDFKIRKVKEYQDHVIEGEMIKVAAKQAHQEHLLKEEEKRQKAREQKKLFLQANSELEKLKELKRQKEKEEEKKIEEFAIKKQQMTDLRKRKEYEKFKEKQDIRQKLIDKQVEHLSSFKNREDEILNNQVKDAEEKKIRSFEEKQRRMLEMKRQIDENRDLQLKRKIDLKEQNKREDTEFVSMWKDKIKALESDEKEESDEIIARNKNLANFHKLQIANKKQIAEAEFVKEQEESYKTKLMLNNEQDEFFKYAEEYIKDYYNQGKDITPLILDLKNYKKKLFYG